MSFKRIRELFHTGVPQSLKSSHSLMYWIIPTSKYVVAPPPTLRHSQGVTINQTLPAWDGLSLWLSKRQEWNAQSLWPHLVYTFVPVVFRLRASARSCMETLLIIREFCCGLRVEVCIVYPRCAGLTAASTTFLQSLLAPRRLWGSIPICCCFIVLDLAASIYWFHWNM